MVRKPHWLAAVAILFACEAPPDTCHDGVVEAGAVCFEEGVMIDEAAHALVDFDGDGIDDLIAWHEGFIRLQHNRGDATFEAAGSESFGVFGNKPMVLDDLDENGVDELGAFAGVAQSEPRTLSIFERDAEGTFVVKQTVGVVVPPTLVGHLVGDFDGDGDRDLVFHGKEHIALVYRTDDGFSETIVLDPFGVFDPNGVLVAPLVADLDGDGADELCQGWSDHLIVRSGPDLATYETLAWPPGFTHAALGDVDGDGKAEVVAWRFDLESTRVAGAVLERAAPGEPLSTLSTFETEGTSLLLADIDVDGRDDLVLPGEHVEDSPRTSCGASSHAGRIRLADGSGSFLDPVRVPGLEPSPWEPTHLDDDGITDLARFSTTSQPCTSNSNAPLLSVP